MAEQPSPIESILSARCAQGFVRRGVLNLNSAIERLNVTQRREGLARQNRDRIVLVLVIEGPKIEDEDEDEKESENWDSPILHQLAAG